MSKKIRPGRVFADPHANAFIVEYIVETLNDENGQMQISSEMKQVVIHVPKIDEDTDIVRVAHKAMKKCKYIPEKWIDKVAGVLQEIQLRNLHQSNNSEEFDSTSDFEEGVSDRLESNLELLYGDEEDKNSALKNILPLCMDINNLEYILSDHPLMSALSRILSDPGACSSRVIFNVVKIFLSLADFPEFHEKISKYRIGASVIATIDLEVRRADHIEKDMVDRSKARQSNESSRSNNTLFICFQILIRLSDDSSIMRKMLRKNLTEMLLKSLRSCSKRCLDSVLLLLIRATVYEEVVHEICAYESHRFPIMQLVYLLSANDNTISRNSLRVLFNLSFNEDALTKMVEANIIECLTLDKFRTMKSQTFGILYHISSFENMRNSMIFDPLIPIVLQSIPSNSKDHIVKELTGFLINMSVIPMFAEQMMPSVEKLVDRVRENNDILLTKLLRNLSVWTRKLQIGIEIALETRNNNTISLLTKDHSKYVKQVKRECSEECPRYFNNYRSFKFWNQHIEQIASICSTTENEDLLIELIGVLNHLTINDMAPSLSWSTISQKYSLLALVRRCTVSGMNHTDMNMEAVILCNQICSHAEGASLIAKADIISSIIELCDDRDEDTEFLLQTLCLCETLLSFGDTRKELLINTDAIQIMFDCLSDNNREVKLEAQRCLESVENYDRDKSGTIKRFALIVKERRFIIHNNAWLKCVMD